MGSFGRNMTGHAMIECAGNGGLQHRGGGGRDEAIKNDRDTVMASGKDRPRHGREFATAKTAQNLERIGKSLPVAGQIPVCEDAWHPDVCETLAETGAELLLVPNGSPYFRGKRDMRATAEVS